MTKREHLKQDDPFTAVVEPNHYMTYVGVDSGRLLIIDPAYLGPEFCAELDRHRRSDGSYDTKYLTPKSRGPLALVVNTGTDGYFAVEYNADEITIELS